MYILYNNLYFLKKFFFNYINNIYFFLKKIKIYIIYIFHFNIFSNFDNILFLSLSLLIV